MKSTKSTQKVCETLRDMTFSKCYEENWCTAFEAALDRGAVAFRRGRADGVFLPRAVKGFPLWTGRPLIAW